VRRADRIAVIERGTLTELGSHDELLTLGGMYSRLHNMQFGEDYASQVEAEDIVASGVEGTA